MSQADRFEHRPVMVDEVVDLLGPVPAGPVVDATVGGGGHSRAILQAHPHLSIVGLDRDADALSAATDFLHDFVEEGRAALHHARFDALGEVLDAASIAKISGALFDLGVSSPQLDRTDRGFSYRGDAPLDMRMDRRDERSAADVVNRASVTELADLFAANGESRFAGRIAKAIVRQRPIARTSELAEIVRDAIPAPARRTGGHPAKRVFQALRIEVNRELEVLPVAIDAAIERLAPGGRLVVLSYHSGEDRIVKARFLAAEGAGCTCPPRMPCVCGAADRRTVRLLQRGARKPTAAEVATNPRAESARLRGLEKLTPPATPTPASSPATPTL
ncbi:MAG TPA: 16S rRNA (cytosine(1402)-N(4))-methyltransferase RsmH [Acidimicrobiales bacterium]|nr:16S rRNA (cytosine(1402)-N(4))-methyltransferase RsmH [Acidimicrobiales bacterium]